MSDVRRRAHVLKNEVCLLLIGAAVGLPANVAVHGERKLVRRDVEA